MNNNQLPMFAYNEGDSSLLIKKINKLTKLKLEEFESFPLLDIDINKYDKIIAPDTNTIGH